MYPSVGEVNLHAVFVVYALVLVEFLHLSEDGVYINLGREVNTILGNAVVGVGSAQFAHGATFMC